MWVTVQDEDTPAICKGRQIVKTTKSSDMWTRIETQICRELDRNEKKQNLNRNDQLLIPCNYCDMQFVHLPSSYTNL